MSIVSSLSSILGAREDRRTSAVMLVRLDSHGNMDLTQRRSFQYFPETISDSRSVSWNEKNVIGGSHPIYQWTNGSARTISFEAVFTNEVAPAFPSSASTSINSAVQGIENLGNNDPAIGTYSVSIAGALAWLRANTYPAYSSSGVASAPPKMVLFMPNSGIVSQVDAGQVDSVPVVMMSCNITYEAFFRDGTPRIVTVALEFAEIVQLGTKNWGFVSRDSIDPTWKSGKDAYTLKLGEQFTRPAIAQADAGKFVAGPGASAANGALSGLRSGQ